MLFVPIGCKSVGRLREESHRESTKCQKDRTDLPHIDKLTVYGSYGNTCLNAALHGSIDRFGFIHHAGDAESVADRSPQPARGAGAKSVVFEIARNGPRDGQR